MRRHTSAMPIDGRDEVRVSGRDALTYLQGQVSQDLLPMQVGEQRWTFVLAPNGRVEVLARVRRTGDAEFVLDTDAGFGEQLAARLARFKIRVQVDIDPVASSEEPAPFADDAARVEAGWPAMGTEIVPGETIPAETGVTPRRRRLQEGLLPGPGAGRADGLPWGRRTPSPAHPRRVPKVPPPATRSRSTARPSAPSPPWSAAGPSATSSAASRSAPPPSPTTRE